VKLVYEKKMRWVRNDRASGLSELQSIGPDNFRMKSKFERATGLLEKHGA
jgi:phage protein U